jgi:hypothetical protein
MGYGDLPLHFTCICIQASPLGSCVCIRRTRRPWGAVSHLLEPHAKTTTQIHHLLFLEQTTVKVHALVLCPVLLAHSWFNYSFDTVLFLYEKSRNMGADKLFEFTGVCG